MEKIEIKTTKKLLGQTLYGEIEDDILDDFSKSQINELMKQKSKDLQHIYDCIEEENYQNISPEEFYSLGDIINLLNNLKITIERE